METECCFSDKKNMFEGEEIQAIVDFASFL